MRVASLPVKAVRVRQVGLGLMLASWFLLLFPSLANANTADALEPPEALVGESDTQRMDRLVEYIERRYPVTAEQATVIVRQAFELGRRDDLDPELILAVIAIESTFRPTVVSRAGARGLMQVIPKWHPTKVQEIGGSQALFDPEKNIYAGTKILLDYLRAQRGDLRRALLKYNGSLSNPASRYADKVLSYLRRLQQIAGSS